MDNEDKVKDLVERSKDFFLRESVSGAVSKSGFQLDTEFAKTKKNKSIIVIISIVLFVAIFTAGAVIVTLYIQRESTRVPVNINAFADVNLKEVLDRAKKYENQRRVAERELEDLQSSMEREIQEVRENADREIELINTRNYSKAETARRIRTVEEETVKKIEEIRAGYQPLIEKKKEQIAEIQENLDAYDSKMVEQAKKQEEVLNNQQKRFELEMEETVTYYENQLAEMEKAWKDEVDSITTHYESLVSQLKTNHANEVARLKKMHADEIARLKQEHADAIADLKRRHANEIRRLILKYNPVFDSGELAVILATTIDPSIIGADGLGTYKAILSEEQIITEEEFTVLRNRMEDSDTIMNALQDIPYENSIPSALRHLEYRNWQVVLEYERIWRSMSDVIEEKNAIIADKSTQISNFQFALESLVQSSRENGYILDPRDGENIIVFMDTIHKVRENDIGYVFRKDDEVIGTVQFFFVSGRLRARLIELTEEENPIQPFDKILIQVQ